MFGTISVKIIKNNSERNAEVSKVTGTKIDKSDDKDVKLAKELVEITMVENIVKTTEIADDNTNEEKNIDLNNTTNNESSQVGGNEYKPATIEDKPVSPSTTVIPPEVVIPEIPEITYPTVDELKQFMINYGIGLGKTHDPSLDGVGIKRYYYTETWSPWIGQDAGANQLFGGFNYNSFGITVIDLGNGWVEFAIYVSEEEYFG